MTTTPPEALAIPDILGCVLGHLAAAWAPVAAQTCRAWNRAYRAAYPPGPSWGFPPWCLRPGDYVATRALVEWARGSGAPWSEEVVAAAALRRDFDMLRWATAAGAPWNWRVCAGAASRGDLSFLRFARRLGVPLTSSVCAYAAHAGEVATLAWAAAEGALLRPADVVTCARWGGHAAVLRWLVAERGEQLGCSACGAAPCRSCSTHMWLIRSVKPDRLRDSLQEVGYLFGWPGGPNRKFAWLPQPGEQGLVRWCRAPAPKKGEPD